MKTTGTPDLERIMETCARNCGWLLYSLKCMHANSAYMAAVCTSMPSESQVEAGDAVISTIGGAPKRQRAASSRGTPAAAPALNFTVSPAVASRGERAEARMSILAELKMTKELASSLTPEESEPLDKQVAHMITEYAKLCSPSSAPELAQTRSGARELEACDLE